MPQVIDIPLGRQWGLENTTEAEEKEDGDKMKYWRKENITNVILMLSYGI